ncbi:MAG: PEP-CTERM sorting domain-containing protein, partial [Verrucomicrobiota bacterium]
TTLKFGSVSQTLGSLTIGAGSTVTFTGGEALGSFSGGSKVSGFVGASTVPEPGTIGLLLVGALGFVNRRRRQA